MSRSRTRSSKKKTVTIAVLVACLLLAAIGGTIAWMTVKDDLTNQFIVGNFNDPTTKPDPDNPEQGGDDELDGEDESKLNGHLYEPNWTENSKLLPGSTVKKDPIVGIGVGSEDAYVFLHVDNNINKANDPVYFTIDTTKWEPVEGKVYEAKNVTNDDPGYVDENTKYYTGGLFMYKEKLSCGNTEKDAWTAPLFEKVYVKNGATGTDFDLTPSGTNNYAAIEVTALLHQTEDPADGTPTNLETVAVQWAKDQVGALEDATQNTKLPIVRDSQD